MTNLMREDADLIANAQLNWEKLKGKTVLVSGANGYVPQFFIHGLLRRNDLYGDGITVVALCRSKERADLRFSEYYDRDDFKLLIGNVTEPLNYNEEVHYIIHAASPASRKARSANLPELFNANAAGCNNLLKFAEEKTAEFLFVSSIDTYGKPLPGQRLREDFSGELNPLEQRNVYSCAKRAAETLCICYHEKGVSSKIVRPSQILGNGIELDDGRLHVDFISQILSGNSIVLKGDGTPIRSFMYVTDAIVGMLYVLLEGKSGEAYNVVTEEGEASVLELAQMMASLVPERNVEITYNMETRKTDPDVTKVVSVVCGDSTKLRSLGWKPEISLREACRRMMQHYGVL